MRLILSLALCIISSSAGFGQQIVTGKVVSAETGEHLPFATIENSSETIFTNISGNFQIKLSSKNSPIQISYPDYLSKKVSLDPSAEFYLIKLSPKVTNANLASQNTTVNEIIDRAIKNKPLNDPEQALNSYSHRSYNKLIIDKQSDLPGVVIEPISLRNQSDTTPSRSFLSEKVFTHLYKNPGFKKEIITGLSTAGFEEPVYEVLRLNIDPPSVYGNDYPFFSTSYAGPLGKNALNNYTYKILDTVATEGRQAYLIYFKPKRDEKIPGWEGIFFLDMETLAVQRAKMQLYRATNVEVDYDYEFRKDLNIWFPTKQQVVLKPGTGEMDITIFGGNISLGTVQRKRSILNTLLETDDLEEDLALTSTTTNFEITINEPVEIEKYTAAIKVMKDANEKPSDFWEIYRQEPLTVQDELTTEWVRNQIEAEDILRQIEVLYAVKTGYYPYKFWNFDLSKFIKYNNYEGFRVGVGGETNEEFSKNFRLNGYTVYGLKDKAFKYGIGGGALLNGRTGTWFNLNYEQDIREVGAHTYIRGVSDFSILEPRFANISYYYAYNKLKTSLEHRLTPRMDAELVLAKSDISQLREYAFFNDGKVYRNYSITEATFGFLWRPFSKFISTPKSNYIYDKNYPVITGQVTQGISGLLGGDFQFTKLGLKAEYQHFRQNGSITQVTLEGNYGLGELPLTHAFHAFPNNPNKPEILGRFSLAGNISFETMYFNEFFSERQAAIHIKHQFSPFKITPGINPELVLISRHVIGDFNNKEVHQNIEFNTLENVYSEAGLELNKIFFGFGLSTAYRYGAYHLPTFKENFSLKVTFQLSI